MTLSQIIVHELTIYTSAFVAKIKNKCLQLTTYLMFYTSVLPTAVNSAVDPKTGESDCIVGTLVISRMELDCV